MITKKLAAFICLAILTIGSANSQSWQIETIKYNEESGLFISFPVMDSISVKLLERGQLKRENAHVWSLYFISQREKLALEQKFEIAKSSAEDWERLFNVSETQIGLYKLSLDKQKELTTITKRKARKNGLLLFGGGLLGGLLASILIIN